jgi:hypothetical protein
MNKDNRLMLEALQSKFTQTAGAETHVSNALQNILKQLEQLDTAIHMSKSSHVDQLLSQVRDAAEMMMSERGSGTSEDAEGFSDAEYHKMRKDALHGAGEELGHGPIKVQLKQNTTIDCYKAGTVQGVRFTKGTIFNCDENVGDYYECDTEEYGGVAVFPDDVTVLSERPAAEDDAEPIMKNHGAGQIESGSEDAEHRSAAQQAAIAIALQKAGKKKS